MPRTPSSKSSFFQRVHLTGLWTRAQYPGTPVYGIVGMQISVLETGRGHASCHRRDAGHDSRRRAEGTTGSRRPRWASAFGSSISYRPFTRSRSVSISTSLRRAFLAFRMSGSMFWKGECQFRRILRQRKKTPLIESVSRLTDSATCGRRATELGPCTDRPSRHIQRPATLGRGSRTNPQNSFDVLVALDARAGTAIVAGVVLTTRRESAAAAPNCITEHPARDSGSGAPGVRRRREVIKC